MSPVRVPSLAVERRILRAGASSLVGIDEVGRGSIAGPVTVGAVLVRADTRTAPTGVRDSKALTATQREALAPKIRRWAPAWGVGHAHPEEVDVHGLMVALRLAALRALRGLPRPIGAILLDGSYDWLSCDEELLPAGSGPVTTLIKADAQCSSVAAASVLAKVARDRIMVDLAGADDRYGWRANKGYSAPEHSAGLAAYGPSRLHRLSWQLAGVEPQALEALDPGRIRTWRRMEQGEQLILLAEPEFALD